MNAKKISKSILALLITVPALLATNAMAQELKKPTLEDLIPGGETYHKPETNRTSGGAMPLVWNLASTI